MFKMITTKFFKGFDLIFEMQRKCQTQHNLNVNLNSYKIIYKNDFEIKNMIFRKKKTLFHSQHSYTQTTQFLLYNNLLVFTQIVAKNDYNKN